MISYKDAGVDIDAGNSFVEAIKPFVKSTFNDNVLGGIGSFSGAFKLPSGFKNPALLGATDGVGTKLRLAIDSKKFDTIGIDLVAMCVNDLICNFATPLFFLDYYATAKLDVNEAKDVVKGISEGCKQARCALIGGETAEMPGLYQKDDFDLAGFAVGMAEVEEIDRTKFVKEDDVLIALPSSGIHSNGYSLVRKLFFEKLQLDFSEQIDGKNLIDVLLAPTRIYVDEFLRLKPCINAMAHITGGGITENLPRVLPDGLQANVRLKAINSPEVFKYMSKYVEKDEMFRTFNMGVGMVLVVSRANVDTVLENCDGYIIGEVVRGEKCVKFI
ncbi:phosphoribosylformylglycinamidine cyclo-ligase [Campylobacter geochelonis]|uniref:phosphoribosylformylglycinamidine cyclo-ligase n=1 Tax=Campylobacter geochelonis TaxID=1780362 RepID=UPI000770771F|nr:phosphoribosylformylglycinamidine cyclo-ligase [Campylobacter geochelonis]CZE46417.1 phosphoribosylaminoimidazole synthetase [Campylobacter geochelonis]CZE50485.1 phosphoribosylaminoimidazole synthetase [Campylobacter geochelonis]